MQRYRVNFPLLIGLVVGTLVLGAGTYGLWRFQQERNAGRLIERAEEARNEGDLVKASNLLAKYVRLRPEDESVLAELAKTMAEIAESPTVEPKQIGQAIGFLEGTVREQASNSELRRRLVDLLMSSRVRMYKPALDHISQLLNQQPGDPELEVMYSTCLFATGSDKFITHAYGLIGYDATSDEFDVNKATAPDETMVYLRLANKLRNDREEPDLADRIVDQMIEANSEDGKAWLAHGQYLESNDRKDEALEDYERALELAPEDPAVVVANARPKALDEDYDGARELLLACLEKQPDSAILYQTLAEVEVRAGDYDKALERYEAGVAAVPIENAQTLLFSQARLQIEQHDNEGARKTIAEMREAEQTVTAFVDYLDARLTMSENRWFDAVKEFERLQDYMVNVPGIGVELQVMRGFCYEKLGQTEKSLEAYNTALQIDPTNTMAGFGRSRARSKLGQRDEETNSVNIYTALTEELAKPESEQDWVKFDEMVAQYIERLNLSDAMKTVLQAEVLMRRGLYDESRVKLVESYKLDPNNLGVRRAAVKLFASDPEQGPVKALKLLDKVVADFGDLPILRLERADLLMVINDEDLTEQLFALTDGTESWTLEQKGQLWSGLANKFERLRDTESRKICLARVAEFSPSDLPTLLRLFMMAREGDDEASMQDAQDRILKVVGNKENATWLFTEAHRLIAQYRANGMEGEELERADELVERALAQRGEWHQLHQLQAEIDLLKGDEAAALASFDRAAQFGRPTALSLYQHVKLLTRRGRFADALREMERVAPEVRQRLLGREYAASLLRTGRVADGATTAQELAETVPNNGAVQLWLGQFLSQASEAPGVNEAFSQKLRDEAGDAFRKAVELNPNAADAWLALTGYLVVTGNPIEAEDVIRRAQLALVEDETQLLFARCYELIGRAIDAEALYKQAVEEAEPSDVARTSRLLAQFYLGSVYRSGDKAQKATPLINTVLREAAEGRVDKNDPNVRWARSTAARLLASGKEYQQLRDAERLLTSNAVNGNLPAADRLLMAEILAPRPEPVSRLKAAKLLEELDQTQDLSLKSSLDLGRLYFTLGKWDKCRSHMITTITKHPDNPQVRSVYLSMLLDHGTPTDIDTATRQLQLLIKLAPKSPATREMVARVAHKRGKKREASLAIASNLPRDLNQVTAEQLPLVKRVARQLVGFEDYDMAAKYYQLAAKLGGSDERLDYAEFVGRHVDAEQGFEGLEKVRGDVDIVSVVQHGLAILREQEAKGETPSEDLLAKAQVWVDQGLREDPDRTAMRLQQAEVYDIQRRYDEAAETYRGLLKEGGLKGMGRAVVLNNLAYLLALSQDDQASVSEAAGYVNEAVDLLGPQTDILDTRAVIAIAAERYDDAVADLELAVIDRPTASKFFHKAVAHLFSGQTEQAVAAWQRALELGLTRESVSQLEREQYDRVKQQLDGAALRSAQR